MNDRASEEIEKLESQRFQLSDLLNKIINECQDKAMDDYNANKISKEELDDILMECIGLKKDK